MPRLPDDRVPRLLRIAQRLKRERDQARFERDVALADWNIQVSVLELWLSTAFTLAGRDEPERLP
jgi:hypothetical protein